MIHAPRRKGDIRREKNIKTVLVMQIKTDSLAKQPRASASAANEEFAATTIVSEKAARPRSAGWDPYEVWRTRVKPAQVDSSSDIAVGH